MAGPEATLSYPFVDLVKIPRDFQYYCSSADKSSGTNAMLYCYEASTKAVIWRNGSSSNAMQLCYQDFPMVLQGRTGLYPVK
eukprot:540738-Rhodomonas_salina.1